MIILTNCLTDTADEGCVKTAVSLVKRIKQRSPETMVVTYDWQPAQTDVHMPINKLMLSRPLIKLLREKREPVLYIPFPARSISTAIRIFILSLFAPRGLRVLLAMRFPAGIIAKALFRMSSAHIITLSHESYEFYRSVVGEKVSYLKCGVDTKKFHPVDAETKARLREKYGVEPGKRVLTHVGHLKEGRNVRQLLNASSDHHVFLVVSTLTENERDASLRSKLEARPYTNIIDTFLENIEEIYQLSDVYFFPVQESCNCIDVPLSVMEAAACGVPVVATEYGELKELIGKDGFWFTDSFEPEKLDQLLKAAVDAESSPRDSVMEYDWDAAVGKLLQQI